MADLDSVFAAAVQSHGVLVAEAGTGTGKTFAYLVPALMAGEESGTLRNSTRGAACN